MTSVQKHRFHTLDAMRGVAAVVVMLFHFRQMLIPGHEKLIRTASDYFAADLFFLLSGFVIACAYDRRLSRGMRFGEFVKGRLICLLPMHAVGRRDRWRHCGDRRDRRLPSRHQPLPRAAL